MGKHGEFQTHLCVDFFGIAFCFYNVCFVQHAYYESRHMGKVIQLLNTTAESPL